MLRSTSFRPLQMKTCLRRTAVMLGGALSRPAARVILSEFIPLPGVPMSEITRRELLRTGIALSTGSLVARGPDALAASAFRGSSADPSAAQAVTAEPTGAVSPRERLLFDFGWKFHLGCDSPALRDLGAGDGLDAFSKTGAFAFATEALDDSAWRSLDLPHDWAVELPFVRDEALQSHGYKPLGRNYRDTSIGWYRRTFEIPATDAARRIILEFDVPWCRQWRSELSGIGPGAPAQSLQRARAAHSASRPRAR